MGKYYRCFDTSSSVGIPELPDNYQGGRTPVWDHELLTLGAVIHCELAPGYFHRTNGHLKLNGMTHVVPAWNQF